MSEILSSDNLKLLLCEDGLKYYLFTPSLLRLFPKSGNMRKMSFMQIARFLVMKKHGYNVYILTDDNDEILSSIVFSSGGQYRFPFATKNDLIYGPSYTVPKHRGKGYAVKLGIKALSDFEKSYEKVFATVREENLASMKCLEKTGFNNIGTIGANSLTKTFYYTENGDHFLFKYER